LKSAHWFGVGSQDSISDIVEERLSSSEGEDLLDDSSGFDVLEFKDRVVSGDENAEVLLVGGESNSEIHSALFNRLSWIVIMAHVWVQISLQEVSDVVSGVSESDWHLAVLELDVKDVKSSSLVFSNL
jgi:hypothetical protein